MAQRLRSRGALTAFAVRLMQLTRQDWEGEWRLLDQLADRADDIHIGRLARRLCILGSRECFSHQITETVATQHIAVLARLIAVNADAVEEAQRSIARTTPSTSRRLSSGRASSLASPTAGQAAHSASSFRLASRRQNRLGRGGPRWAAKGGAR